MNKIKIPILLFIFMIIIYSCGNKKSVSQEYLNEINNWHSKRIQNLKKENGWLNLIGLFWIKEGENTFGSDKSNDIIFPEGKADKFLGKVIKSDSVITTIVNKDVEILNNGKKVTQVKMLSDISGNPTVLSHKTLRWFVIKRGDKYGIRLRDLEAELLRDFEGIDRFDVDDKWRIKGKFVKYETPKIIEIPTIIGTIEKEQSPGKIVFNFEGKEYKLLPVLAGNSLFIVFADLTSGIETYGAGRFLYIDQPDEEGNVILDFNKAYNPPCAFTKFATCPLPPDENKIKLSIKAGEKKYGKGH